MLVVPPLTGHLNPALGVAASLGRRQAVVAWAVHAGKLRDKLPEGARIYDLDDQQRFDLGASAPDVRGLESVRVFFEDFLLPLTNSVLPLLEKAVQDFRPDVLVVDHQMPAGALVARKLGIPWVTLVTTSASILRMSDQLDTWVAEQFSTLQQGYLPPHLHVPRPDFSPFRVVVFSVEKLLGTQQARQPADYAFVGPCRGMGRRSVDFPWSWLNLHQRKLLVTLGTVSRDRDTRFFEVMMAALADMDVQAVMVAPESLAAVAPPNVLVRPYIPQVELMGRMQAVVCHGGHNTVCEALSWGLPLGLAPIRDDQPVIARQVIDADAGLFIRHGKVTPAVARQTITALLNQPELAQQARRLASALREARGEDAAADCILNVSSQRLPLERAV